MPLLIRGSRENGCEKYFHEEYARDIIRMHVSEMLLSCQITGRIIFAGGRTMVQQPAFCRFPLSLKDCGQALVQALREHVLQQHCIIEGLRASLRQCEELILGGLAPPPSSAASESVFSDLQHREGLLSACEQALLAGYALNLQAAGELFVKAYYRLVRSIIYRQGFTDDGIPSADDVYQDVFLGLHSSLSKKVVIKEGSHLSCYVASSAFYACGKAAKRRDSDVATSAVPAEDDEPEKIPSIWPSPIRPSVLTAAEVEEWEEGDWRLRMAKQNLINRIIFAHYWLENRYRKRKFRADRQVAEWERLANSSDLEVLRLHSLAAEQVQRFPRCGVVLLAAGLLNNRIVRRRELAVIYAAATGMDFEETKALLRRLRRFSVGTIHARICRMSEALGSKEKREA